MEKQMIISGILPNSNLDVPMMLHSQIVTRRLSWDHISQIGTAKTVKSFLDIWSLFIMSNLIWSQRCLVTLLNNERSLKTTIKHICKYHP